MTEQYEAVTESEWKALATTEITHLTDEEKDYLPRAWDEWLARVRRDAAREALDGLAEWADLRAREAVTDRGAVDWRRIRFAVVAHRDQNYPEETP